MSSEFGEIKQNNNDKFHFENLIVYQRALDYIDFVYDITEKFPPHELYGITSQFRRAASSIALNIGEGTGGTFNEFNNFLRISRRSIRECVVCTSIAIRRKYISDVESNQSRVRLIELSKMISGLKKSLKPVPAPNSELNTPNSQL